jgi:dTDP-4-amino-4,6-dideoxygalactose transaminase
VGARRPVGGFQVRWHSNDLAKLWICLDELHAPGGAVRYAIGDPRSAEQLGSINLVPIDHRVCGDIIVIPYGRHHVDEDDVAAVAAVLRGDWLTRGPAVTAFEEELACIVGVGHAVAFCSGTAALHAAALAAGLGAGDVVATSALTFAASAACTNYVGARVSLVDIDEETLNIDLGALPRCDALVAVHYAGLPVDLTALSSRPKVVIEDAAHALGAMTPDGPVGACAHSDMCVFSFHPMKAVTTGEGGAVTTNDAGLDARLRRVRHHGIVPRPEHGGWHYEIPEIGHNFRMSDINAALGSSQLRKLDGFLHRRQELAAQYREAFRDAPVVLPPVMPPGYRHAYHLFPIRVNDRRRVYEHLRSNGIGCQVHYVPLHHHPAYADGAPDGGLPVTDGVYSQLLSIPLYPALTDAEQATVVRRLLEVVV